MNNISFFFVKCVKFKQKQKYWKKVCLHFVTFCFQLREHELQNNISLRNKQKEIQQISAKIEAAEEKLGDLDVNKLAQEDLRLKRKLGDLTKQVGGAFSQSSGDKVRCTKSLLDVQQFIIFNKFFLVMKFVN